MTRTRRRLSASIYLLALPFASVADVASDRATQELRAICQELIDAVAPGNVGVWQKYLDDRLVRVDENGVMQTKAQMLKELTPLPPGLAGSMAIDSFKVELHGNVAVAAYEMQEHLDYHGQPLASRYRASDTWLHTPQGWRLISEQVAAILKDPPAIKLAREKLCEYEGSYSLTKDIQMTVKCAADGLSMERAGRPAARYLPEVADVFFAHGQPRSRRIFERDAQGGLVSLVDRREGEDIRWIKQRASPH